MLGGVWHRRGLAAHSARGSRTLEINLNPSTSPSQRNPRLLQLMLLDLLLSVACPNT